MISKKTLTTILVLILLGVNSFGNSQVANISLEGKVLFSFDDSHFILETNKYNYKISKLGLSDDVAKNIELAVNQNSKIEISLPVSQIKNVWLSQSFDSQVRAAVSSKSSSNEILNFSGRANYSTSVKGNLMYSFEDLYYLIDTGETIVHINKSDLDSSVVANLNQVAPGSRVSLPLPKKAIDMTWSSKPSSQRSVASIAEESESMFRNSVYSSMSGTLEYSPSDESVIVKSKDHYYQINRKGVSTRNPQALDNIGGRVNLTVPNSEIEAIWPIQN